MGQGTESCGGYEIDDDPYEDGLAFGDWTQKGGGTINVAKMSVGHLRNAKQRCKMLAETATFSNESDKWNSWVEIFDNELDHRSKETSEPKAPFESKAKVPPRGKRVELRCHCGKNYTARVADLKRGWGMSCSRSCSAIRREYGRPEPTVNGQPLRKFLSEV